MNQKVVPDTGLALKRDYGGGANGFNSVKPSIGTGGSGPVHAQRSSGEVIVKGLATDPPSQDIRPPRYSAGEPG